MGLKTRNICVCDDSYPLFHHQDLYRQISHQENEDFENQDQNDGGNTETTSEENTRVEGRIYNHATPTLTVKSCQNL